jgi:sensor histidine kinase YesM
MTTIQTSSKRTAGKMIRGERWLIFVIIAVAVFFAVHLYTSSTMMMDEVKAALLITGYFMISVALGRQLMHLWIVKNKTVSSSLISRLLIALVVCIVWLFVAADLSVSHPRMHLVLLVVGLPFLLVGSGTGMIIKLYRHTIREKLYEAKASAEQSQSELKLLQTQLSPHFLFNTLNNMYGLSLTQHEKIPGLLLKLSSLLRYSVYDARELFVPLKNELAYINDYIDFEKIRIGDRLVLQSSFEEPIDQNLSIAPLLLIVFIENAFKHAKNTTDQKIYIYITLKTWGNSILFSVKNSSNGATDQQSIVNNHSGFGLDNVRKRLELLYKDKYDLQIQHEEGFYHVLLNLKVK